MSIRPAALLAAEKVAFSGYPQQVNPAELLKEAGVEMLDPGDVVLFEHRRAWMVTHNLRDEAAAIKFGTKLRKLMLPRRDLAAAYPLMIDLPLYVVYNDGFVVVDALAKAESKKKGPSITEQKDAIIRRGESVFGSGSIKMRPSQDDKYILVIQATDKDVKKLFPRPARTVGTLVDLAAEMEHAIGVVAKMQTA